MPIIPTPAAAIYVRTVLFLFFQSSSWLCFLRWVLAPRDWLRNRCGIFRRKSWLLDVATPLILQQLMQERVLESATCTYFVLRPRRRYGNSIIPTCFTYNTKKYISRVASLVTCFMSLTASDGSTSQTDSIKNVLVKLIAYVLLYLLNN